MRAATHVINVQGDEPLIDPKLISKLAKALMDDPELDMVTAATPFDRDEEIHNPNAVKVVLDRNRNALYFSRAVIPSVPKVKSGGEPARSAPGPAERSKAIPHLLHLGIYGYTTPFLRQFVKWKSGPLEQIERLEQLRALENGAKIRVVLTKNRSIGVDAPEDVRAVERLLRRA